MVAQDLPVAWSWSWRELTWGQKLSLVFLVRADGLARGRLGSWQCMSTYCFDALLNTSMQTMEAYLI
jgi:hypothetical protein